MSALFSAFTSLQSAIQAEVSDELSRLRQELEHERKLRLLLEHQVAQYFGSTYTKSDVDTLVDACHKRLAAQSELVRHDGQEEQRRVQRELEHRIEVSMQEAKAKPEPRSACKPQDQTLLTREVDRKLGTLLVDVDQKLDALRIGAAECAEEATRTAVAHADHCGAVLSSRIESVQTELTEGLQELQQQLSSHEGAKSQLGERLDVLQTRLEQQIGMVQLEVDQVAREVQRPASQTSCRRAPEVPERVRGIHKLTPRTLSKDRSSLTPLRP